MEFSFLYIFSRSIGQNSDMWNVTQVHCTEKIYNQVILGDWAQLLLGETNFNQTGGIGKTT